MKKVAHPEWKNGRRAFARLKAKWTSERIAEDTATLQKIFDEARKRPLARLALEWAEQNGVQFFIDRGFSGPEDSAYYTNRAGVVALAAKDLGDIDSDVKNLVHEIRHAWQETHGLDTGPAEEKNPPDFGEYFVRQALLEADAWATGEMAGKHNKKYEDLFMSWFKKHKGFTRSYGEASSRFIASLWELDVPSNDPDYEFAYARPTKISPLNFYSMKAVLKLGEAFNGENYFHPIKKELREKVLKPSLAQNFYGAATPEQRKLTAKIHKAALAGRRKQQQDSQKNLSNKARITMPYPKGCIFIPFKL